MPSSPGPRERLARDFGTVILLAAAMQLLSCASPPRVRTPPEFDLQGHRGARGLLPENSIPAFLEAVRLGVRTVELDVVVSADSQIVVSHEPWMSDQICSHPDGTPVTRAEREQLNLFRMSYARIAEFDCGSRGHPGFPDQQPRAVHKPLLSAVFDTVRSYTRDMASPPEWNIETKSSPGEDHRLQPEPDVFVDLLLGVIREHGVEQRVVIQSFDARTLQALRRKHAGVRLALLVGGGTDPRQAVDALGFVPDILSPDASHITPELVGWAHTRGMRVIPWTVNEVSQMQRVIGAGVDGLITDYPNRFVAAFGRPVPTR